MRNTVELHLSPALQSAGDGSVAERTESSRRGLRSRPTPPVTLSWMSPHYFIMYSRLCLRSGLITEEAGRECVCLCVCVRLALFALRFFFFISKKIKRREKKSKSSPGSAAFPAK